jgi:hypothetical protein
VPRTAFQENDHHLEDNMRFFTALRASALIAAGIVGLPLLSGAASASGDVTLSIKDSAGYLLPEAAVSCIESGDLVKIEHSGVGTVTLPDAFGQKFDLHVEHPVFGEHDFVVQVPSTSTFGHVIAYVSSQGVQVKFRPVAQLSDFVQGSGGVPLPFNCPAVYTTCQLPDVGNAYLSAVGSFGTQLIADNFEVTSNGNINRICVEGYYIDLTAITPCHATVTWSDAFSVTYYNDDAGGLVPGSVKAGPFAASIISKGQDGNILGGAYNAYQYNLSHAAVAVTAGECLWVEVINNGGAAEPCDGVGTCCNWWWSTANGAGDNKVAYNLGGGWTSLIGDDMAFCLVPTFSPPTTCGPPPPSNDDCANATAITGRDTAFNFDNTLATTDGPFHAACEQFTGSGAIPNDVWYCWTAPTTGDIILTTIGGTGVDTNIAIYDGCSCPPTDADLLACNDDAGGTFQSEVQVSVVAGNSYLIRIGTFPGSSGGTGLFGIFNIAVPANNDCVNAEALSVPSTTAGTTLFADPEPDAPFCGTTSTTAPAVWYTVVGDGTTYTASLCNGNTAYDSKITVYCGDCNDIAGLTCVTGNDDFCGLQSEVSWCTQPTATYLVMVHGFSSGSGDFELDISSDGVACSPSTGQCLPTSACCVGAGFQGCVVTDAFDCAAQGGEAVPNSTCGGLVFVKRTCEAGSFIDISGHPEATELFLGDDSGEVVPLDFTFNFYGDDHTTIAVCSNGYLTFGADLTDFSNDPIPDTFDPNDFIAPFWDDLDPSAGGTVHYLTIGPAPNRRFVAQWTDIEQFFTGDSNTFQAILYENSNCVSFRYGVCTPEAFAGDYTIGIENQDGTTGEAYAGTEAYDGNCLELCPAMETNPCTSFATRVDVVPGVCPNPFDSASNGALWVSILGTPTFNVNDINVGSVYMTRYNYQPIGPAVSPFEGPPGPFSFYQDSATPFSGPMGSCHAVGPDGVLDLSMRFDAAEVTANLGLDQLPFGTKVDIMVSGMLSDGTWFQGVDSLTMTAPTSSANLKVRANIQDTWVEVSPLDNITNDHGWTGFDREFTLGTQVTLKAPATRAGNNFRYWEVDGLKVNVGNNILQVTVTNNMKVKAIYGQTRSLWGGMGLSK